MNELVSRLTKKQPLEVNRPDRSTKALKERIDLGYVHVLFKETGTELCIKLDKANCTYKETDFEKGRGKVHLEGGITLNYDKVRCVADVELKNMEGTGWLVPLNEKEYDQIMK